MLDLTHDELGDADPAGFADRLTEQSVGHVAALARRQVIRLVEEAIVDSRRLDEVEDVDAPGLLERGGGEVRLGEHHEAAPPCS